MVTKRKMEGWTKLCEFSDGRLLPDHSSAPSQWGYRPRDGLVSVHRPALCRVLRSWIGMWSYAERHIDKLQPRESFFFHSWYGLGQAFDHLIVLNITGHAGTPSTRCRPEHARCRLGSTTASRGQQGSKGPCGSTDGGGRRSSVFNLIFI